MSTTVLILVIVLVVLLVGAVPAWPHARGWGYGPMGILVTLIVLLLILHLVGVLKF